MYRGVNNSPHFTRKTNSNIIAFSNSSAINGKKVYLKIVLLCKGYPTEKPLFMVYRQKLDIFFNLKLDLKKIEVN